MRKNRTDRDMGTMGSLGMLRDQEALMRLLAVVSGGQGRIYNPEVERTGDKLVIPEGANLLDVIATLERKHLHEEQVTNIHVTIPVSPWDGAMALKKAIEANLGVFTQKRCSCGDPKCGVHQMDIEVELGKTMQVPWGTFELPGMEDSEVTTRMGEEDGRAVFSCHVTCKRRYEERVRRLLDKVREIATKESLHRGKAFSIAFKDANKRPVDIPRPKFFVFSQEEPIFRADLEQSIERNVFTPIWNADQLIADGDSVKRGILFAGYYGVGKTLLATKIAREATKAGWTFIYVKDSNELREALRYAQQYQPVVIFAEDVDRVAGVKRTDAVNDLLNQLDGIDSKSSRIITILTSNNPDTINEAMLRPGRIDLVVEVPSPDAETVTRMIDNMAGARLDPDADLGPVSELLAGQIPARIREAVSRAKLEMVRRTGSVKGFINGDDLVAVAKEVKAEAALFRNKTERPETHSADAIARGFEGAASVIRTSMRNGLDRNSAEATAKA